MAIGIDGSPNPEGESEVAHLRWQIASEFEAMRRGLYGLSLGNARHDFIQTRMHTVDRCQALLAQRLGKDEADRTIYRLYVEIIDN